MLAERRERTGADERVSRASRETLFEGQLLAERPPIGTVETLQAATPQSVRAFHDRWYRPDNAVIVVVGDYPREYLASLVEKWFADWQVAGKLAAAPDFGAPKSPPGADPANPVGETHVVVEPGQPRGFNYAYLRPYHQVIDNLEYNRGNLIDAVAMAVINRRLEARARGSAAYLTASVDNQNVSRSANGTFVSFVPLSANWKAALKDVRGVIAGALAQPPDPGRDRPRSCRARRDLRQPGAASRGPGRRVDGRRYRQRGRHPRSGRQPGVVPAGVPRHEEPVHPGGSVRAHPEAVHRNRCARGLPDSEGRRGRRRRDRRRAAREADRRCRIERGGQAGLVRGAAADRHPGGTRRTAQDRHL